MMFWLTVAMFVLVVFGGSAPVLAQPVNVGGTIASPPPSVPPLITLPQPNTTVQEKSLNVAGDCTPDLTVKIFRNADFAGSALCRTNGTFALHIDLIDGRNDLIARQYDTLNQSSPDSDTVTVFYNQARAPLLEDRQTQDAIARFQLVVDYEQTVQSIFKGQMFRLPIRFNGGVAPYAVSVDWGDSETTLFSRTDVAPFAAEHTYEIEGYKTITIKISDSAGGQAAMEFVVLVQGAPAQPGLAPVKALLGTPLAAMAVSVGISVALGFVGGLFFALWFWVFKK